MGSKDKIIPLFIVFVGFFIFGMIAIAMVQDAEDTIKPTEGDNATDEQIAHYNQSFELSEITIKILWGIMVVVIGLVLGVGIGIFMKLF